MSEQVESQDVELLKFCSAALRKALGAIDKYTATPAELPVAVQAIMMEIKPAVDDVIDEIDTRLGRVIRSSGLEQEDADSLRTYKKKAKQHGLLTEDELGIHINVPRRP